MRCRNIRTISTLEILTPCDAYMHQWTRSSLAHAITCLFSSQSNNTPALLLTGHVGTNFGAFHPIVFIIFSPSAAETWTFRENEVNTMAAEVSPVYQPKPWCLLGEAKWHLAFHGEDCPLPTASQYWKTVKYWATVKIFHVFYEKFSTTKSMLIPCRQQPMAPITLAFPDHRNDTSRILFLSGARYSRIISSYQYWNLHSSDRAAADHPIAKIGLPKQIRSHFIVREPCSPPAVIRLCRSLVDLQIPTACVKNPVGSVWDTMQTVLEFG